MSKKPLIMKFQIMAYKGTYRGHEIEPVTIHYDSMTELINGMRKLYREGYTDLFVTVKGVYGRRAIPWAKLKEL